MDDLDRIGDRILVEPNHPALALGARAERVIARVDRFDLYGPEGAAALIEHATDEQQACTRQVEEMVAVIRNRTERRRSGEPAEIGPAPCLGAGRWEVEDGHPCSPAKAGVQSPRAAPIDAAASGS